MSKAVKGLGSLPQIGLEYWKNRVNYSLPGERWVDIIGFERYYQVSSFGRVRSKKQIKTDNDGFKYAIPGLIKKQTINRTNYLVVALYNRTGKFKVCQIHQLVCKAFRSNKEQKPCVNHKNFITTDNRSVNLEWVTHKENSRHAYEKFKRGEDVFLSKLKSKDVIEIYLSKDNPSKIKTKYSISIYTVYRIKRGLSWGHITSKLGNPGVYNHNKINIGIANKIRNDYNVKGVSAKDLCKKYGLKKTNIGYILNNKRWKV